MSDLRGLSAATSEEGSRPKHECLHRIAMPDLHLRGGRQNHSGHIETNHSAGDVQHTPTERGGAGSGGHDCQNHEGSGGRLNGSNNKNSRPFSKRPSPGARKKNGNKNFRLTRNNVKTGIKK